MSLRAKRSIPKPSEPRKRRHAAPTLENVEPAVPAVPAALTPMGSPYKPASKKRRPDDAADAKTADLRSHRILSMAAASASTHLLAGQVLALRLLLGPDSERLRSTTTTSSSDDDKAATEPTRYYVACHANNNCDEPAPRCQQCLRYTRCEPCCERAINEGALRDLPTSAADTIRMCIKCRYCGGSFCAGLASARAGTFSNCCADAIHRCCRRCYEERVVPMMLDRARRVPPQPSATSTDAPATPPRSESPSPAPTVQCHGCQRGADVFLRGRVHSARLVCDQCGNQPDAVLCRSCNAYYLAKSMTSTQQTERAAVGFLFRPCRACYEALHSPK